MTNKELTHTKEDIFSLLKTQRIYAAIPLIKNLVNNAASGELSEELDKLNLEYQYLLKYFAQGINDPEREHIYYRIIRKLQELIDKAINEISIREVYDLYFDTKRIIKKSGISLQSLLDNQNKVMSNINMYSEVNEENTNAFDYKKLLINKEQNESDLFKYVWTSFPQKTNEIDILKSFFESESYPSYLKTLLISAILLSLMRFYNEQLLILLLNNYNSTNHELSIKSLCVAILILFLQKDRVKDSVTIQHQLKILLENQQFVQDVKTILFLLIRSKNTEKLTKKVETELIPKLMKIYPKVFRKFKSNNITIDLSDLESNPQWKEILENNGITKKIDELNKLQMEGSDVFIGTFSHLKSFPFFAEISNWFLPFHQNHSMLLDFLGKDKIKLIELILDSKFFCDSDKYSFVASLVSVPSTQRNMMLNQFDEQNNALNEIKNATLPSSVSEQRESIANLYIQNIYRFFKLYSRKNEFIDPLDNNFDIIDINVLTADMDLTETVEIIGEFYLRNEYYKEAIKYFRLLYQTKKDCNPVILQKIGFCYQNLEKFKKAIESYQKYELLANKDLWNIRHLATCYRALKQPETALNYYYEAESLSPENVSICLNIGHCLLELNRYEEALKYYYKVYYLEPNSPRAWRPIAWCLFIQGNYEQCHTYYNKIIHDKPTSSDYMNYGHLYFVEGDIQNATSMYKKSIEKDMLSISEFNDNFMADENTLVGLGIKKSDISILINALSLEIQSN